MSRLRLRVPSPALVVSIVALVIALGGTSYAALLIGTNNIRNKAVTNAKLAPNSVGTAKIRSGAVTAANINTSGLTVPSANALNGIQIVPSATQTQPGTAGSTLGNVTVTCPTGKVAIGGNQINNGGSLVSLNEVNLNGGSATVYLNNLSGSSVSWQGYAVCVSGSSSGAALRSGSVVK